MREPSWERPRKKEEREGSTSKWLRVKIPTLSRNSSFGENKNKKVSIKEIIYPNLAY